jgi:hypothetical protein
LFIPRIHVYINRNKDNIVAVAVCDGAKRAQSITPASFLMRAHIISNHCFAGQLNCLTQLRALPELLDRGD